MKKYLQIALKVGIVLGLLVFLSKKGFLSIQDTRRAFENWQDMALSVSILLIAAVLGALRWQWLLRAQGIELGFFRTCELTFVGNFFNIALPGAVSGDFIKAFYVGKEVQGQRARAFGSILFDRVAGLSVLMLISAMALPFGQFSQANHNGLLATVIPFIAIAGAGFLFFYAYLFAVREKFDPILILLRRVHEAFPKAQAVTRIYESIRHYHHHRGTVVRVFLLSLFIQTAIGMAILSFARALGEDHLSIAGVYMLFPLGLLVTAIPVAPAGVGTGHAAFAALFGLLGSSSGANIFTLYAMGQIAVGAIGGLVYLRFRSEVGTPLAVATPPEVTSGSCGDVKA
jgi:uncharacterized protein (TIRG00374 family)